MTNVVIWHVKQTGELWACADTRVSVQVPLTDQAAKILPLHVQSYEAVTDGTGDGWEPKARMSIGFAYAGHTLVAMMTHAALSVFLSRLGNIDAALPSLEKVAELTRFLLVSYTMELIKAGRGTVETEVCVFGWCPELKRYVAFHVHLQRADFAVSRINVIDGEYCILGADAAGLLNEIESIKKSNHPGWQHVEPRIALGERIRIGAICEVGGTLQAGIAKGTQFRVVGSTFNKKGGGAMHYLGFSLAEDIEPVIGNLVVMTGIL